MTNQSDIDTGEIARDTVPNDMRDVWRSIQDHEFIEHQRYQEQQWRAVRENAHLLILEFEKAFVKRCRKLSIPMFAHTVVRTKKMQQQVFKEGHSNNDGSKEYAHQHCAADIVHSRYGWNLNKDQWKLLGHIGKEVAHMHGIAITWGGDWKNPYDPAHWELAQWRERAKEVLI